MSTYTYKAFISYSHKDTALALEMHKALENYRVPKRLVGQSTDYGLVPAKLGQFFRDRDELPAAENLSTEVSKALKNSEFLIVLCSPSAAASRWVNKEIMEFKKMRGEKFVLPLILSGEPWASDAADKTEHENECFPPALRFRLSKAGTLSAIPTEPIAADIRDGADGKKRAIQKLIAGLLGVGLDKLVERELQRKHRRVMAVTGISVLAMIVMAALTYQAMTARNAAEKHRAEAEGLIEFMLTDLRKNLEPVGRLDVLDSVATKVVDYYDEQDLTDVSDDALGRRARAFHMLGQIQNSLGNVADAGAMYNQAQETTASLLERTPNNAKRIFEHAQSVFYLGNQALEARDFVTASQAMNEYKRLALQLIAIDPDNREWQHELGYAHTNIGVMQLRHLKQYKQAYQSFENSLKVYHVLLAQSPNDANLMKSAANQYAWMADAVLYYGTAAEVGALRQKQLEILQTLHKQDPKNKIAHKALGVSLRALGLLKLYQNDYKAAAQLFSEAVERAQQLSNADPDDFSKKRWLGFMHFELARAYFYDGAFQQCRNQLKFVSEIAKGVLSKDTISSNSRIYFDFLLRILGYQLNKQNGTPERDHVAVISSIIDYITSYRDKSVQTKVKQALHDAYPLKIEALIEQGKQAEATALIDYIESGNSALGALGYEHLKVPRSLRERHKLMGALGRYKDQKIIEQRLRDRGFSVE